MKKILITGAAGFIGRHLITHLVKNKDFSLKLFDKNKSLIQDFPFIETIIGDIRDKKKLKEIFLSNPPQIIVHLAAVIKSAKEEEYFQVNVQGTRNLIQQTENFGVRRFIFLSTDYVLYRLTEPYTKSKQCCEEFFSSSKLNFTIFRPTPVFGKGDNKNFATLISLIKKYPILPAIKCQM